MIPAFSSIKLRHFNKYHSNFSTHISSNVEKYFVNKAIPGIYYLDIGSLNNLYQPMQINENIFPKSTFGDFRLVKFGKSKNLFKRLKEHQNTKTGYGRWSNNIENKWSLFVPEFLLTKAEMKISKITKEENLKFKYVDPFGKQHRELILIDPKYENKIKKIYKSIEQELQEDIANIGK
jgi:hypothetical protein